MFAPGMKSIIDQEMVRERGKLEDSIKALEKTLRRAKVAEEVVAPGRVCNIAKSYNKWDCYEDIDELECQIGNAKQDLAKLDKRIEDRDNDDPENHACGHRYQCSCSGNKSAERKAMEMGTAKRLEEMARLKKEGNVLYAQRQIKEALVLYEKSLILYEYCFDAVDIERHNAENLRMECLLNAASCFLQIELYRKCVEYCDEALEINSGNTKAWFRRGRAHRLLGKFDSAETDLLKAMECSESENSKDIKRELIRLRKDRRKK